jgi:hypothetical protein
MHQILLQVAALNTFIACITSFKGYGNIFFYFHLEELLKLYVNLLTDFA